MALGFFRYPQHKLNSVYLGRPFDRTGAPVARIAAGTGFFWLLIMIGLVLGDYGTRFEDSELGRPRPEVDWGVPAESNKTRPIQ